MKLNFPPQTELFALARELSRIGYIISVKCNKDGSHDVFEKPAPAKQPKDHN